MADKTDAQKTLKELQMEELKSTFGVTKDPNEKSGASTARSANSAKIAKLYDDAGEYEADLEGFEHELDLINQQELKDIIQSLRQTFPNYEGDYAKELQNVLEIWWKQGIEIDKTLPKEPLEIISSNDFNTAITKLPNFEKEIRDILVKRWEMIINIKKEHIKEELAEMKLRGMKPDHVRKVYRAYHGLDD